MNNKPKVKARILENNIELFYNNILALSSEQLRPPIYIEFTDHGKTYGENYPGFDKSIFRKYQDLQQVLISLNCSIIINCFSLFEASFEWRLIRDLSTEGASEVQKKILNKYMNDIIKNSSIDRCIKDYKFITGNNIIDIFSDEEKSYFNFLKDTYIFRHLLVHGSVTKHMVIPIGYDDYYNNEVGYIRVDDEDIDYQDFLNKLKKIIPIPLDNQHLTLEVLLKNNKVADTYKLMAFKVMKTLAPSGNLKFLE